MASGFYGLTLEKFLIATLAESYEAEDNKVMLTTSTYTPDYNAHDFRNDVTNEVSGTGYSSGGIALTSTEITVSSGNAVFDAADSSWAAATFTARQAVHYFVVGSAATDALGYNIDFGSDVASAGGTFTIQYHASGIWSIDFTP